MIAGVIITRREHLPLTSKKLPPQDKVTAMQFDPFKETGFFAFNNPNIQFYNTFVASGINGPK